MKKAIRRTLAVCLAALMLLSTTTAFAANEGLQNFKQVATYDGRFKDVQTGQWYSAGIAKAYELGLMKGRSDTEFGQKGNLTNAEMFVLAARLHNTYYGNGAEFPAMNPWYQAYTDYLFDRGIIVEKDSLDEIANQPAIRLDFAAIMRMVFPKSALPAINSVTEIPDVAEEDLFLEEILDLYNAGILAGSDKYGNFHPYSNITRAEVATILGRMVDRSQRVKVDLVSIYDPDKIWFTKSSYTAYVGDSFDYDIGWSPDTAEFEYTLMSSDVDVVSVGSYDDGGLYLYAEGPGKATITVETSNGVKATATVNVTYKVTTTANKALANAKNYLKYNWCSYKKLYNELKAEGFSDIDIRYAIDNCGVDWNQQALKCAKEYRLTFPNFGATDYRRQLAYEGFTEDQIEYVIRTLYQ